jgi:hypothetical protein
LNLQSSPLQQALPLVSEEGYSEDEDIGKHSVAQSNRHTTYRTINANKFPGLQMLIALRKVRNYKCRPAFWSASLLVTKTI